METTGSQFSIQLFMCSDGDIEKGAEGDAAGRGRHRIALSKVYLKSFSQPTFTAEVLAQNTQNVNELFNNVVWTRLRKSTFVKH